MNKIPITVGVTGHRNLRQQDIPHLRIVVRTELQKLKNTYPDSPFVLIDSLAEGADQLCAEIALELGFALIAPLPFQLGEYRQDFKGSICERFDTLCAAAAEVFTVPDIEGMGGDHSYGYRQAGIYVSTHSHVLLALWDGTPAVAGGCGTAETADIMLNATYFSEDASLFSSSAEGAVLHIVTPREDAPPPQNAFSVLLIDQISGSLAKMLDTINRFNTEDAEIKGSPLIAKETFDSLNAKLRRIHAIYQKADALSVLYRNKYLKGIKGLSAMGVLLVLAFLLYDELNARLMLPFYAAVLILSYTILLMAKKGRWHERYLENRALSEALRVQFYLGLCGIDDNICDSYTWTQKLEAIWVKKAVSALLAFGPAGQLIDTDALKASWIDSQLEYHNNRLGETGKRMSKNERLTSIMLLLSITVFVLICAAELFIPSSLASGIRLGIVGQLLISGQHAILSGKSVGLIILGLLTSVTLFLTNYYGKLSLDHRFSDHKKMAALYSAAQKNWNTPGIPKKRIAMDLAREEIVENGAWLSYRRDNSPSVNL